MALMQPPEISVLRDLLQQCEKALNWLPDNTKTFAVHVEIGRTLAESQDPVQLTNYISQQQAHGLAMQLAPRMVVENEVEERDGGKVYACHVTVVQRNTIKELMEFIEHVRQVLQKALNGNVAQTAMEAKMKQDLAVLQMHALNKEIMEPLTKKVIKTVYPSFSSGELQTPLKSIEEEERQKALQKPFLQKVAKLSKEDRVEAFKVYHNYHPDEPITSDDLPDDWKNA